MPEMIGGHEGNLGSLSMQLRHICLEYPYAQLEMSTNGFDESRRLGSGTAGTVYRGEMPDGSDVAVKVIDVAALGDDAMVAGFEEEIAVLSKFRHPNLVVLMGWAREGTRRFLIYEFLSGGDVFQRLSKNRLMDAPFIWHERLAIARNAATGLAHLHNATPHAFHRDIKSANILLGGGSAKMADFGLSCVAKTIQAKDMQCKFPSGTPGYTCPAYIRTGKVTEGSEVYSFGMVMLEMLLNLMPAGMMDNSLVYPIHEAIRPSEPDAIDRCLECCDARAGWPQGVAGDYAQLALGCIHPDDGYRPRFNEICRSLKAIQERYPTTPVPQPLHCFMEAPSSLPTPPVPHSVSASSDSALSAGLNNSSQPDVDKKGITRPLAPDRVVSSVEKGPSFNVPRARSPQLPAEGGYPGSRCPEGDESISPPKRMSAQRAVIGARRQSRKPSEVWPSDCDVSLEVGYVHGTNLGQLPQHVRVPSITPTIDADGRRIIQIGRHSQQQWFEALLEDPVHRNSVSRISCDITWGGNSVDPSPMLRTLGSNLLVVDEVVVGKDQHATLRPGSQIRFMFQCDGDVADLLMFVVNATPQSGRPVGDSESDPTPPLAAGLALAARKGNETSPSAEEEMWRFELVYAVGLTPEASMEIPVSTRTFCFVLTPNGAAVVLGRQHQMAMFEAILQGQKELLAFVSRSHLQLELAAEGQLRVTNLSQNVSIAGRRNNNNDMLLRGQDVVITSGDTISFAAQAEMVPGIDKMPIIMRGGEEKELAPFLTFRAVKTGARRRTKSAIGEA